MLRLSAELPATHLPERKSPTIEAIASRLKSLTFFQLQELALTFKHSPMFFLSKKSVRNLNYCKNEFVHQLTDAFNENRRDIAYLDHFEQLIATREYKVREQQKQQEPSYGHGSRAVSADPRLKPQRAP